MRLSALFLTPPAWRALHTRYTRYRQHGTPPLSAALGCLLVTLMWMLFPLERPNWQAILQRRRTLWPQIDPQRPRPLDGVRYLIQALWLLLARPIVAAPVRRRRLWSTWRARARRHFPPLPTLPQRAYWRTAARGRPRLRPRTRRIALTLAAGVALLLALICITQPFNPLAQLVFVLLMWSIALLVRRFPGRFPALMLIVLSLTISGRYIWWRYTATLNWHDPLSLICGLILLFAESYAWLVLVLGYIQEIWPLRRAPAPLPADPADWPTVDIFVPTYNEDLHVVSSTIYACLGMDWPRDKLNIWLLDDGDRPAFRQFARQAGIRYLTRPTHEHAKAGNINHALRYARGEYVVIFDSDHIPTRAFLQLTMGWFFKDKKLAMLQTPQHFFSPDPFERNLGYFRRTPNEGALFYGLVQDGNDMWNATFFCGSCAVIRRAPLEEIGGLATETVTEDAHTSLRLHRRGYSSAYIRIPQSAGLATESLSAHIGQRIRWARGMVQILRIDNPLRGKGLTLAQRLCYFNAMLHFLAGIPRLIFLTAPLAFLLLHAYIIYAPALMILLYVLPHMVHASLTNSRIQGKFRHAYWSELYETVLAWYIARPTLMALINPRIGKFNVTEKGGLIEHDYIDWLITRPYLTLILLNLSGLLAGGWRLYAGPRDELLTVLISMAWVIYNLLILGGAVEVAIESKQRRQAQRVAIALPAALAEENGRLWPCTLHDYSGAGVGVQLSHDAVFHPAQSLRLLLKRGAQEFAFPVTVRRCAGRSLGLQLAPLTTQQRVDFMQCTFARADTWALWQRAYPEDRLLRSLQAILAVGLRGYVHLADAAPGALRALFRAITLLLTWLGSFVPRPIAEGQISPCYPPSPR